MTNPAENLNMVLICPQNNSRKVILELLPNYKYLNEVVERARAEKLIRYTCPTDCSKLDCPIYQFATYQI